MRRFWKWLKRWGYVPFFVVGVLLAWILVRRWSKRKPTTPPSDRIRRELEAIREGAKVDRLRVELGHWQAVRHVEDKFQKELADMDAERRAEAARLAEDPEALTRFIIRGRS